MDDSFKKITQKLDSITAPIRHLQDSIHAITLNNSSLKNTTDSFSYYEAIFAPISQYNKSMDEQLENTIKAMSLDFPSLNNAINLSNSYREAIDSLTAPIIQYNKSINEQLKDAIKATTIYNSTYSKALDNFKALSSAFAPITQQNKFMSEQLQDVIKAVREDFLDLTESLDLSVLHNNPLDMTYKQALQDMFELETTQEITDHENILSILLEEDEEIDEEREKANEMLYASTFNSIFNIEYKEFKKLSIGVKIHLIKVAFTIMILLKLFNVVIDSGIDFLKDIGQNNSNITDTEKLKKIKNTPETENNNLINKISLRVITGNNVNVRTQPSIKSKAIDKLYLNDTVEVIEKKKNWTKVSYEVGTAKIEGWIFTRYTKKV